MVPDILIQGNRFLERFDRSLPSTLDEMPFHDASSTREQIETHAAAEPWAS